MKITTRTGQLGERSTSRTLTAKTDWRVVFDEDEASARSPSTTSRTSSMDVTAAKFREIAALERARDRASYSMVQRDIRRSEGYFGE